MCIALSPLLFLGRLSVVCTIFLFLGLLFWVGHLGLGVSGFFLFFFTGIQRKVSDWTGLFLFVVLQLRLIQSIRPLTLPRRRF